MSEPPAQADRAEAFRALHRGETFVIPNPWDAGSALALESLGFRALATTSGGFAFTLGRRDGSATLDEVCDHVASLAAVASIPISADLEHGYGRLPEDAAKAITRVAEAGAVGGSIEDFDPDDGLYDAGFATERVAAAVEAARALDFPFTLTARAENHLRGNPDLDDTIERLRAYEAAGADVVYAPFLRTTDEIAAVCDAVSAPVNVLGLPGGPSVAEIAAAGGTRVSVGSSLTWVAMDAAVKAATALRDDGDLGALRFDIRPGDLLGG